MIEKRNNEKYASDKWRELNRALLFLRTSNQIKNHLRKQPKRGKIILLRMRRTLDDYAKRQKHAWLKRDIRRVRDDLLSTYPYYD